MMETMRRVLAVVLAALLAVPPGVYAGRGDGGERELGRRFFLEARSQIPLADDPALSEWIESLGARLVESLGGDDLCASSRQVTRRPGNVPARLGQEEGIR